MINAKDPNVIRDVETSMDITNDILYFSMSLLGRIISIANT